MNFEDIVNKPINNSWVISLLKNQFQSCTVFDCWNNRVELNGIMFYFSRNHKELIENNQYTIVCFDDEVFESQKGKIEKFFYRFDKNFCDLIDKTIFIFKTERLFNKVKNTKIKKILFPYFDIMEDIISIKKLGKYPDNVSLNDNIFFFSLNGTYNNLRKKLLLTLFKFDLFENGYVTCHLNKKISSNSTVEFKKVPSFILKKTRKDEFAEKIYFKTKKPCDRLFYEIENIPCTLNLKNYFHISKNIPGSVYLGVESFSNVDFYNSLRCPSDKTILPFICKRLPLILGEYQLIYTLRNYGFDMFDDILDHSHDDIKIENFEEKVIKCVTNNYNILKKNNFIQNNEINSRLKYNQNHLVNIWYKKVLGEFIEDIKQFINF